MRPLCQRLQHRGINGDGRSDRASLQYSSLCVHPHPPPRRPVGADLRVRPSSPERRLFCGRTRRSAPTQATSARQFHSSNAVTPMCRDARMCLVRWRPLCQKSQRRGINGDGRSSPTSSCRDARSVRPLRQKLQHRGINGDGRSDRASLQYSSLCVRCVKSYNVQATKSRSFDNGRSDRASLQDSSLCVRPR